MRKQLRSNFWEATAGSSGDTNLEKIQLLAILLRNSAPCVDFVLGPFDHGVSAVGKSDRIPTQEMMSARGHRKAQYRRGMRRFASSDAPARTRRPRHRTLDAGDRKFRTPLVKLLDKLSHISKEAFHADFP